jgi:hypothetical protein
LLALKENQPATYVNVVLLFDQPLAGTAFETREAVDGGSGRIATRRHRVCTDID